MSKFSIITTAYLHNQHRVDQLRRCRDSLISLQSLNFEWIFVDDGSTEKTPDLLIDNVILANQPHLERIHALRKAMSLATGEWFMFVDADDELFSYSLEAISQMIDKYPDQKMFNFASFHVHENYGAHIRNAFEPAKLDVGHDVFGGGNIVNGTFVFHRSVFEDLGGYPDDLEQVDTTELNYGGVRDLKMTSPYDFSVAAQLEFPEIRQFFLVGEEDPDGKVIKELGNPWGQDYYLFYKYTRKYYSMPINVPLYIVHHEGKDEGGKHAIG